ncbi:hypothetical protein B0J12DRAFT_699280 [Macrophomina phaseolina]|uniref:Uncharacterized protein n=1 Tax=Macrophomina phaseolina TaxID=35725 RepID=A0ABQ8GBV7_9PEZI|nr:hypothetical protein B0J12DRAFT_699280 [Macrophomina phaseolina]
MAGGLICTESAGVCAGAAKSARAPPRHAQPALAASSASSNSAAPVARLRVGKLTTRRRPPPPSAALPPPMTSLSRRQRASSRPTATAGGANRVRRMCLLQGASRAPAQSAPRTLRPPHRRTQAARMRPGRAQRWSGGEERACLWSASPFFRSLMTNQRAHREASYGRIPHQRRPTAPRVVVCRPNLAHAPAVLHAARSRLPQAALTDTSSPAPR